VLTLVARASLAWCAAACVPCLCRARARAAPHTRYKQLLLKQRDIMIALTARLNERDEQIMTLQVRAEGCRRVRARAAAGVDCMGARAQARGVCVLMRMCARRG
jgi:hypothetical protein